MPEDILPVIQDDDEFREELRRDKYQVAVEQSVRTSDQNINIVDGDVLSDFQTELKPKNTNRDLINITTGKKQSTLDSAVMIEPQLMGVDITYANISSPDKETQTKVTSRFAVKSKQLNKSESRAEQMFKDGHKRAFSEFR